MEFELLFTPQGTDSGMAEYSTADLVKDLRLDIVLDIMSGGNHVIYDACKKVITRPLTDLHAILSRNAVLKDALGQENAFFELFEVSYDAVESVRTYLEFSSPRYDRVIPNAKKIITETEMAALNINHLRSLNNALSRYADGFSSDAMRGLCRTIKTLFDGGSLSHAELRVQQLGALKTESGLSIIGHIGDGLKQTDILLNGLFEPAGRGKKRFMPDEAAISLSSMALIRNAEEIVESALAPIYKAIAGFNRSIQRFFEKLRFQTGFYTGCVNIYRQLDALNVPLCFPQIKQGSGTYIGMSLTDAGLALKERGLPAANDFLFTGKRKILITGPNQGGKTTFLRSVGLAQVMAQCGMFIAAREYICPLFSGVFTHFPCGEDGHLRMGLLETELCKLSEIAGVIKPGGLLFMNESFQTTMPFDAKRLAHETVSAFADAGVTVLFVTHLYAYAMDEYQRKKEDALFLRAQRGQNGMNTYEIREGEPFKSAFGMELFHEIIR